MRACNWLQALEGDIDDSHVAFLHYGSVRPEDMPPSTFIAYATENRGLRFEVEDTEYGVLGATFRPAGAKEIYWRFGQFLFPFYTNVPTGVIGAHILTQVWVPMDDHHTMWYRVSGRFGITDAEASDDTTASEMDRARTPFEELRNRVLSDERLQPNTTDWFGRFRPVTDASNDYGIDRDLQNRVTYSGMPNLSAEDQAVTESMGSVCDRTQEHLGRSDLMIVRVRRRLAGAVRALADDGVIPPGVDQPEIYRVRSGGVLLPLGADWREALDRWGRAYDHHPEIDLSHEVFWRHAPSVFAHDAPR
jgi:hypothetical protein